MNYNKRRLSRATALAVAAFGLLFFTLLVPAKIQAEPIAITGGSYSMTSPFRPIPRFNFFTSDLQGTNFRAFTHVNDEGSLSLRSNCLFPCTAGSTFSLNGPRQIVQFSPLACCNSTA